LVKYALIFPFDFRLTRIFADLPAELVEDQFYSVENKLEWLDLEMYASSACHEVITFLVGTIELLT
jgi:hypothetical protein